MQPSDTLSDVFNAAAALETLGALLVEVGHDLPPVSAAGHGHLLVLLGRDLQSCCEKLLSPN
jgi:hypothetical protein